MSERKNIPDKPTVPQEEDILNYLNKDMADDEQHAFEKATSEDAFMNDAMEGLESMNSKTDLSLLAQQLRADLKKQVGKKIKRKQKRKYEESPWIYYAVIIVLLLLIAAFLVMKKFF